jgi:hypothetical protein
MPGFNKKIGVWIIILITAGYCAIEAFGDGDLYIFLAAAGDLGAHKNIFETKYINEDYHYYYSVLFAILLKPFYSLSFYWVKFGWLLLNMCLYLHLFYLSAKSKWVASLTEMQKLVFLGSMFLFSFRFLHENIHASQITILIFWCCVYGLYRITNGKEISGAAILALGINIKLLPIVFLPYLLYRAYYKAFGFTIFFYSLGLFLPSIIIGHDYNMLLLKTWLGLINPTNVQHVLDVDERSFHGLSTLLSTLLVEKVPDYYALNLKRNIADISLPALAKLLMAIRIVLVAFTLYFLRSRPFKKAHSSSNLMTEIAYVLLIIPLIFPHQQHYAFLFSVPAFSLAVYTLVVNYSNFPKKTKVILSTFLLLIYLTANLKIILGTFNMYYEHYKILTYGALLLIPLLAWVSRKNLYPVSVNL